LNAKRKRLIEDMKKYPYYYKICEACDAVNARDEAFCISCNSYRFEGNITKISERADQMLTILEEPLNSSDYE
jgi:RNA polymerase subunit RPABC4/transcription elongation factor Spt4